MTKWWYYKKFNKGKMEDRTKIESLQDNAKEPLHIHSSQEGRKEDRF